MKRPHFLRRRRPAFTIVELLVVIAIISLLAGLILPGYNFAIQKALSTKCSEQLRSIGVAVLSDATDNNGVLPEINQAAAPIYGPTVPGIVGELGHYGVTTNTIQCPVDMANGANSNFAIYGSSYEWNPVLDDGIDPVTVLPVGPITMNVRADRIRVCTDFTPIHRGRMNALYGDGHARAR